MNMQKVVGIISVLALAGCGGGSSGGDDDSVGGVEPGFTTSNLAGTWVQTNVNFANSGPGGTQEWVKTRRQTIIVEKDGNTYSLRDCISGDSLTASVTGSNLVFASPYLPVLQIVDGSTLRTEYNTPTTATDVVLEKVSNDTEGVVDEVNFLAPDIADRWDQVCAETIVDKYLADEVKLRTVSAGDGITIGLEISFEPDIEVGQYTLPSDAADVTGYATVEEGSLNLLNPTGMLIVSESADVDIQLDLDMENDLDDTLIPVDGTISINPGWFSVD